jgi:hypothetical protein
MKIFNITQTATKQRKIYPPNFTEITERRRKKFFSANLGGSFFCNGNLVTE